MIEFSRFYAGVAEWQTQQTQNLPVATPWGFDPPSRHHVYLETDTVKSAKWQSTFQKKKTIKAVRSQRRGANQRTGEDAPRSLLPLMRKLPGAA